MTLKSEKAVTELKGVGQALAGKLADLGIESVQDLLFHLPLRYEDRTKRIALGELKAGKEVLVAGQIQASGVRQGRRRSLVTVISDGTGSVTMRQFHFKHSQQKNLRRGDWIQCFGEVRQGGRGLELVHPEYRLLPSSNDVVVASTLTPVYPTTQGLGQKTWRNLTAQALEQHLAAVIELLPADVKGLEGLPSLPVALQLVHRPAPSEDALALAEGVHPAQVRLVFEELLAHRLGAMQRRSERQQRRAFPISRSSELWSQLRGALGFFPTNAQSRVIEEVLTALEAPRASLRLIQGDVGSGKTLVAVAAVLAAVESGFQAVIMAPTALLAEQHFNNFQRWLRDVKVPTAWLTGRLNTAERSVACQRLASGDALVGIGTHALFQNDVSYRNLALVIVDEQHRFGVRQRLALREKGRGSSEIPHQVVMTATPIPRSLAMTFYADMDISVIDEMPPGRQPVETVVLPNRRRSEVQARVRRACAEGRRAYWVCALIEESDVLEAEAATDRAQALREALPELRIGLVHGRSPAAEKDNVMQHFRNGDIDVLVATTVIEVGVDVPRASVMVIENAERMGLAQLHQLRGRVGRGGGRAVCVLLYQPPLSTMAHQRLSTLRETTDGFAIAEKDLALRGPGELFGTRQSGTPQYRVANLARHHSLLPAVQQAAVDIQSRYTDRVVPIMQRWLPRAGELSDV